MLGDGGEEVSKVHVVYPCGMVSISSIGYFLMLVLILNFLILLFISLLENATFKSISRRRELLFS